MGDYKITSLYDGSATVIEQIGERWLSHSFARFPKEVLKTLHAHRGGQSIEDALDSFVADILATTSKFRHPQLLFKSTSMIEEFLLIDDQRLDHLQRHVRRMRSTKNLVVCSAEELIELVRVEKKIGSQPDETNWTIYLLDSHFSAGATMLHPALDMDPRSYRSRLRPDERGVRADVLDYLFRRFLKNSDQIWRTIQRLAPGGTPVAEGQSISECVVWDDPMYGEHGMLFIPDNPASNPSTVLTPVWTVEQSGRIYPMQLLFEMPKLAEPQWAKRSLPLDVIAAAAD